MNGEAVVCTAEDVIHHALRNSVNAELLSRLPRLGLGQCLLAAGCVFQALWNHRSGRAVDWGVRDYDVFYFDDSDVSWEAEDAVIQRVKSCPRTWGCMSR